MREIDFVLNKENKESRWKQIATKQDIVGKTKFAVHMTELTGPSYHSAKSIQKAV